MMRASAAAIVFAACTGCTLPASKPGSPALRPGEILSAQAAREALAPGKSTKADVRAALGEATVIDFDSGYEVWVYREKPREKAGPSTPELVFLFEPSGILAKTRVR